MEYILYCDESANKGPLYGDFFGGCLVCSKDIEEITRTLNGLKEELNLGAELKWTKVTANYLEKYKQIMDCFFGFVREGKVKVRIMFRSMDDNPTHPERYRAEEKYTKLYYQFIKHAFGFLDVPEEVKPFYVRIYLDQLPDTKENNERIKRFLAERPNTFDFRNSGLCIRPEDITDVDSKKHILLQCVDVVMGAMYFRLNNLHKEKPEGQTRRGKRTIAKEKLYRHMNGLIREIEPHFNIGISTGHRNYLHPDWNIPYSHWKFVPR